MAPFCTFVSINSDTMRITLVQNNPVWENRDKNLESLSKTLSTLKNITNLVILPEMFTTGFSANAACLAEEFNGITFNWMKKMSYLNGFAVCGSYIVESDGRFFNRLLFFKPDGDYHYYDKRHLFLMGGEDKVFSSGNERIIFKYNGFRINLQICYDLRFPVWSRNRQDYDLLINVANWPSQRRDAWSVLLKARAIENQCFVAGVNRIGNDGNGIQYSGGSVVLNPYGQIVGSVPTDIEGIESFEIQIGEVEKFRKEFPVWKDADDFIIKV